MPPRSSASKKRGKPYRGRVEHLVSAGGVVCRPGEGGIEVVLCGRPAIWALPKGTPNPGETLEETALREVQEETGLQVRLVTPIDRIQYWFVRDKVRCHKTVHFYLMEPVGGSLDRHDPEFDRVQWFPLPQALEVMTYANEAGIVARAATLARECSRGP